MLSQSSRLPGILVALGLVSWGCSSSPGGDSPTGGTTSSGGALASGGAGMAVTGGSLSTGGTLSTGGAVATGGTVTNGGNVASGSSGSSSGGSQTSGGASSSGGATGGSSSGGVGTGGSGTGGSSVAGAATGGLPGGGSGGSSTGGAATAGATSGGAASGGAATGGAGGAPGKSSPGCGSANPLKSGNFTETINGTARKWVLDVPTGYDANKPYRLVFVWHPLGGSASQVVSGGYNGLKSLANNTAIFVTADGLDGSNAEASGKGWWNVNGADMKLFTAMLDKINANLCVDRDRIFSTGFSFGGMMSYTLGYQFDVFRAIAPCSGDLQIIPHDDNNTAPLPIMAFHGNNDTFVTTARGRAARDKYLARNKCGTQTQAVSPSPCVQYQGCAVTTIWCEFSGGHNTWSEEPQAIWKFFSQF